MNTETGVLYDELATALKAGERKEDLKPVPDRLQTDAEKELAGKKSVLIDAEKDTPLSRWRQQHLSYRKRILKRRTKNKIAKASRKRNRRWRNQ